MRLVLLLFLSVQASATGSWIDGSYSNSYGTRTFRLYVPASYASGLPAPLLIGLHGCTQTAQDFAGLSRIENLADAHGLLVLLPMQNPFVNPTLCWNWPLPVNQKRGQGEPSLIKGMIDWALDRYTVNRARVYIYGVSSGGFMTSTMMACYTDLFAAGMVASGGMYAAATDAYFGYYTGPYGSSRDPDVAGREAWECSGSLSPRIVPVLVFQGSEDRIVIPLNAQQTVEQFLQMNDYADDRLDNDSAGSKNVQLYLVEGLGHAWSGGDSRFPYAEAGPDETAIMWSFFQQYPLIGPRTRAVRR